MMSDAAKISRGNKGNPKGEPPGPTAATVTNLHRVPGTRKVPLQFHVPSEVRREFKSYIAAHETDGSSLFLQMWELWKQHNG